LTDSHENWILSTDIRKIIKCKIFVKIRQVENELFDAGGRTEEKTEKQKSKKDMRKLMVTFRHICEQK
jgi:hypothetical protein